MYLIEKEQSELYSIPDFCHIQKCRPHTSDRPVDLAKYPLYSSKYIIMYYVTSFNWQNWQKACKSTKILQQFFDKLVTSLTFSNILCVLDLCYN